MRPVAAPPADLVQRLEEEIWRIVRADDHLRPLFIERGISTIGSWPPDTENPPGIATITHNSSVISGIGYWYDPGELIYSLSIAYPYLSTELKMALRGYLQAEIERYTPLDRLTDRTWLTEGVDRAGYSVPWPSELNVWPPPAPPIQTIYALWAYANYTGDWAYVTTEWPAIKALFASRRTSVDSYARIAGVIGYYRIAQRLGDSAATSEARSVAEAAFASGRSFATFRDRANQLYLDMGLDQGPHTPVASGVRGQVFFGLVPEVGRFLREQVGTPAAQELSQRSAADSAPLWYATRVGSQGTEPSAENGFHGPDLAWGLFLAQAYVAEAGQAELRTWLDRPWGLGDPWYLQKLVATIEAPAPAGAQLQIRSVSVERAGVSAALVRWNTSLPASGWVEYGVGTNLSQRSALWIDAVEQHRVRLTGLLPDTSYNFRACSTGPGGTVCAQPAPLVPGTNPEPDPVVKRNLYLPLLHR